MNGLVRTIVALAACLVLGACGMDAKQATLADGATTQSPYKPGMGDLMSALQLRHAKLWYAGQAQNWPLVEFELHEVDETLERVVRWHPEEDNMPVAPMLEAHTQAALAALAQSAAKQDSDAFENAFDQFTRGCNGCHQAMKHGFIVIQRPIAPPVTNQRWEMATP